MAEFTSILGKDFRNGNTYNDWSAPDAGITLTAGYNVSNSNFVICIKFVLPKPAKSISMRFCNSVEISSGRKMRYKFTTSENTTYQNATSAVAGDGSFTLNSAQYAFTDVTVSRTFATGTHYMYIWTDDSSIDYNVMYTRWYTGTYGFSASYEELETYKLTISAGTGTTITVNRTASPAGTTGNVTNGATLYKGDALKITFGAAAGYVLSKSTVNGAAFSSGNSHTVSGNVAVAATASVQSFALSVSAGAGTVLTVQRTSSPKQGAATGNLSNGDKIYHSDVLKITAAAQTGYSLSGLTVNSKAFTSGGSHTVSGAVTAASAATVKSFLLSVQAGEGSSVTVRRTSSPKQGASLGALSDGALIYYSDVLSISFAANGGYKITAQTVNGEDFASGGSHTVAGAVAVQTITKIASIAAIYHNGRWRRARPVIYHNGRWRRARESDKNLR